VDIQLVGIDSPDVILMDWLQTPITGQVAEGPALQASAFVALLSDAIADPAEQLPDLNSDDRRGWWGDLDAQAIWGGWPLGSRLWLLTRAKIVGPGAAAGATITRVQQYIATALQPFVDNKICSRFTVTAEQTDSQTIIAHVTMYRGPKNSIALQFQTVWTEQANAPNTPISSAPLRGVSVQPLLPLPPPPPPPPVTWGRTGVGAFAATFSNYAYGSLWQCPITGTVSQMTAYLQQYNPGDTTSTLNVAIYANNSGLAGALLGSGTAVVTLTSAVTAYNVSISPVNVVQGQFYILAFNASGTTSAFINVGASTGNVYDQYTLWPATSLVGSPSGQTIVAGNIYDVSASITISSKYSFVATRGTSPVFATSGQNYSNSRVFAYSRDTLTKVQLLLPNFYSTSVCGGSIIYSASIEYPAGTFQQFKFGGSVHGSTADGNVLYSDVLTLSSSIPPGTQFWIRIFQNASATSAGVITGIWSYAAGGDCYQSSASVISDLTMGGSITAASGTGIGMHLGVIGITSNPSVLCIGDSRVAGAGDPGSDLTGDIGELARSVGTTRGYANLGIGGSTGYQFVQGIYPKSAVLNLAAFATHVFGNHGVNDILFSQTALQMEASMQQVWKMFPDQVRAQCTVINETTSSDVWTTLVNQSAFGNYVISGTGAREAYNTWLRGHPSGVNSVFDIAAAGIVQAPSNSYLWTPGYTGDGIHEVRVATLAIQSSGVVVVP
jgi:phage gp46-like protein